jgi:hypothetical protein
MEQFVLGIFQEQLSKVSETIRSDEGKEHMYCVLGVMFDFEFISLSSVLIYCN